MTYAVLEQEISKLPIEYLDSLVEYIKSLKKNKSQETTKQDKKALFDCIGIDIDENAIYELREDSKL